MRGLVVVVGHLEGEDAACALGKGLQQAEDGGDAVGVTKPVEDGVGEEESWFRTGGLCGRGVSAQVGEGKGDVWEGFARRGEHGRGRVDAGDGGEGEACCEQGGAVSWAAAEVDDSRWSEGGAEGGDKVADGAVAGVLEEEVLAWGPVGLFAGFRFGAF